MLGLRGARFLLAILLFTESAYVIENPTHSPSPPFSYAATRTLCNETSRLVSVCPVRLLCDLSFSSPMARSLSMHRRYVSFLPTGRCALSPLPRSGYSQCRQGRGEGTRLTRTLGVVSSQRASFLWMCWLHTHLWRRLTSRMGDTEKRHRRRSLLLDHARTRCPYAMAIAT